MSGDPYLSGGVDFGDVLLAVGKAALAFVVLLVAVMLMVWFERKVVGRLQNRLGPNVAGPFGLFQTLADGIKLFFKEDIIPTRADRFVFQLAPYLSLVPAFLTFSIIPIGGDFSDGKNGQVTMFGRQTFLQVADLPVGILFFLAMSSLAVYGIMLAGWSSGSKYPLLGSVRASAQAISYEAALGLSLASVLLVSGSLSTNRIVQVQAGAGFGEFIPNWNIIVTGFVPFVVFLLAGTAELNRPPFDLVEAEQEIVGGFHTEYSSIRFALFFLAEFMNTVTMSAIIVTLFFGGPAGPNLGFLPGWLWGFVWFFLKLLVFLFTFVWFRATLPRLRYDQLMDLGWKLLIPLALGWLLLLAGIRLARSGEIDFGGSDFANVALVMSIGVAGLVVGALLLSLAVRTARTERLRAGGLEAVPRGEPDVPVVTAPMPDPSDPSNGSSGSPDSTMVAGKV
ncbi:MAG: NADH-quinone oxidoreductase subunit NuoH [Acidimicrobiales bacterium]